MTVGESVKHHGVVTGRLPEKALTYLHVVATLQATVIVACGISLSLWLLGDPWDIRVSILILVLGAASLGVELGVLNGLRVRYTRYEVSRTVVCVRRGRLLKRNIVIPSAQLLNVTVVQGPLLARWGLAKVTFTCIAHPEPLGPLFLEDAERIRAAALALYLEDPE